MNSQLFDKLKEYPYLTVREDLLYMQDKGIWSGGSAPAWVKVIQTAYFCGPADAIVFKTAWQFVAEVAIEMLGSAPLPTVVDVTVTAPEPAPKAKKPRLPKPNKAELEQMKDDKPGSKTGAVKAYRERAGCTTKEAQDILVSAAKVAV